MRLRVFCAQNVNWALYAMNIEKFRWKCMYRYILLFKMVIFFFFFNRERCS